MSSPHQGSPKSIKTHAKRPSFGSKILDLWRSESRESGPIDDGPVPDRVHFSGFHLLTSRLSPLKKKREDIGYLIYEISMVPSNVVKTVDVILSTDGDQLFRIIETATGDTIADFSLKKVRFCARGTGDTTNKTVLIAVAHDKTEGDGVLSSTEVVDGPVHDAQFAHSSMSSLTSWLTQKPKQEMYMINIFRVSTDFEASRLLAFASQHLEERPSKPPPPFSLDFRQISVRLILDIKEMEKTSGNLISVPKEKMDLFKLRSGVERRLVVGFAQTRGIPQLAFDLCLGVFIGYGRYVSDTELVCLGDADLTAIGAADQSHGTGNPLPGATCFAQLPWPAKSSYMSMLDEVSPKDTVIFFTVLVHLKLANVLQPVSFRRVCRARVYPQDESFWLMVDRRPLMQDFPFLLTELVDESGSLVIGQFTEANELAPSSTETTTGEQLEGTIPDANADAESAGEEESDIFISGNGTVSREVTDDQLLAEWGQLLKDWHSHVGKNPVLPATASVASTNDTLESVSQNHIRLLWGGSLGPGLTNLGSPFNPLVQNIRRLVARGVPDLLRGEVWHLLAACPSDETGLMNAFRILITKPCKYDAVIRRDLTRTYSANKYSHSPEGQAGLFKVSRAYSLYDDEVGYCQGLSFFVATLLLHMPVEQAFALLVQVNNHYGVRELYLEEFKGLHLRFYQLERLLQDQLPELAKHFKELGLETHMYASQWFLTLFTAPFPLPLVFAIVDLFFAEGMIFIFKAAISVLRMGRRELLGMDFEGVLRYLRVTLPKRCLSSEISKELLDSAISSKVVPAKLTKYAKEWTAMKAREEARENPLRVLQQEAETLRAQVNRLESENQSLAAEVVSSKATMHHRLEEMQDKCDVLTYELFTARQDVQDVTEEKNHLQAEVLQDIITVVDTDLTEDFERHVKQMLRCTLAEVSNGGLEAGASDSKTDQRTVTETNQQSGNHIEEEEEEEEKVSNDVNAVQLDTKVLSMKDCPGCGTPLECTLDAKGELVLMVAIANRPHRTPPESRHDSART